MENSRTNIRQHILCTAKTIILGKGFAAVGLNEILTTAQVPKGSFYHYFKSKDAFGEALLQEYFDEYLLSIDALLTQENADGAQRLMNYWDSWLASATSSELQCPCLAVKLGAEVSDLSEPMRLALQEGTDQIIQKLADCIDDGINDGSIKTTLDANQCAHALYQMWLGSSLLSKIRRDHYPLEIAMLSTRTMLSLPLAN
jgi:TetR/AcrR family transcriptional repressor of nem operon